MLNPFQFSLPDFRLLRLPFTLFLGFLVTLIGAEALMVVHIFLFIFSLPSPPSPKYPLSCFISSHIYLIWNLNTRVRMPLTCNSAYVTKIDWNNEVTIRRLGSRGLQIWLIQWESWTLFWCFVHDGKMSVAASSIIAPIWQLPVLGRHRFQFYVFKGILFLEALQQMVS